MPLDYLPRAEREHLRALILDLTQTDAEDECCGVTLLAKGKRHAR
jgi:hypothetical protein